MVASGAEQLAGASRADESSEERHPRRGGERHAERGRRSPPHPAGGGGQGGLEQHQDQLRPEDAHPVGGQGPQVKVTPAGQRRRQPAAGLLGAHRLGACLACAPERHQRPADEPGPRRRAEQPHRGAGRRSPPRFQHALDRAHQRAPAEGAEPQPGQHRSPGAHAPHLHRGEHRAGEQQHRAHATEQPPGVGPGRGRDAEGERLVHQRFSGLSSGKRMTSRMEGVSVRSIASRSTPRPSPPVGGMPCSRARM